MTETYVHPEVACELLGITPRELTGLAASGKIRFKRTFGGLRYDVDEFIARSGSPPEAPADDDKIKITWKRLLLAILIGAVLVPAALWQWGPKLISPPAAQITMPEPVAVKPRRPAPKPKKVEVEKKQPQMRYFW